jgi:protein-tyrosine sulfotransferase
MIAPANQPVFIIGCPRSGTTLLRRFFDTHPTFSCPGESFVLRGAVRFLSGERVAEGIEYGPLGGLAALGFTPEDIAARVRTMALSFHADIAKAEGKSRLALKTAINSFYVQEIFALFRGHAKFVCLVRHGADVAMSLREFAETMEGVIAELMPYVTAYRRVWPAYAAAWSKVTTDMLDIAEENSDSVIAIRYEDLVAEPETVLRDLFEFVDAPIDPAKLIAATFKPREVHGLGDHKTFATARIHESSVGRWKGLPDRVKAEMAPLLNGVLSRSGYEKIDASAIDSDAMRLHELAMMFQSARAGRRSRDG